MGWLRVPCWLRRPQREREANGGVSCGRSGIDDHPPEPCILRAGRLEGVGGADEPWGAVAKDPASLLESKTLRGDTFTLYWRFCLFRIRRRSTVEYSLSKYVLK